jgi:hypothetical protein
VKTAQQTRGVSNQPTSVRMSFRICRLMTVKIKQYDREIQRLTETA